MTSVGSLMEEQLSFQIESGGSIPTPSLHKAWQRRIREKRAIENPNTLFSMLPETINLKDTTIRNIDFITARYIIERYEWLGVMPLPRSCRFLHGIYFDGTLGGALVYVHPTTRQFEKEHSRQAVYLNRGACEWWTPTNTASRMIAISSKLLHKEGIKIIVAYCTPEAGEIGTIYQALGWWYVGKTSGDTMYYLDNKWTGSRTMADKIKWAKNKDQRWQDKFKNLPTMKVQPKYKYIKILGHNINEIATLYRFKPLPYPKRTDI